MTDGGRRIDHSLTIVIDDNRYAAARCNNENTGDGTADFQSARLLGFAGFYGTGRFGVPLAAVLELSESVLPTVTNTFFLETKPHLRCTNKRF
ncbi:hypothetical protein [Corynebacterium sp. HMSC074C04]|uniref:hypothetical protein n=1 Tax=Corynebacterium sp. HMSC074C04 TaxID=1739514 RepID=UPI001FEFA9A5|nr:hypothetical protein [Corynebacterium sp. HMSC074C04]